MYIGLCLSIYSVLHIILYAKLPSTISDCHSMIKNAESRVFHEVVVATSAVVVHKSLSCTVYMFPCMHMEYNTLHLQVRPYFTCEHFSGHWRLITWKEFQKSRVTYIL